MKVPATVYIDHDYLSLGPDATQADLDGYSQNLATHLAERFPGREITVEQVLGGKRAGRVCPGDDEIDEYVRELQAGDDWVDLLPPRPIKNQPTPRATFTSEDDWRRFEAGEG